MTTEQNKAVVRQLLDMIKSGSTDQAERIVASNWVNHDPVLPPLQGVAGARQLAGLFHDAFPDAQMTVTNLTAEGDRVGASFGFSGTHKGPFLDLPATGKRIDVQAAGIFRVVDGKVTDNWVNIDGLKLMQQLGVAPAQA
jgi:steroid delta-isomerase-like uncharacterized protein